MQYMPEGSTNWYNEDGSIAVDGTSDILDQANASTPSSAKSSSNINYSDVNSSYQAILDAINEERSWNAQQAEYARDFTAEENRKARNFNSAEAQAERDWQTEMSNTSYQRAMADMKAAGLNPVLAAKFGGASSGSGASASTSSSSGAAASSSGAGSTLVTLLSKFIDAQTSITTTAMNNSGAMSRVVTQGKIDKDLAEDEYGYSKSLAQFKFEKDQALLYIENCYSKIKDANDFYQEWMKQKDSQEFQENLKILETELQDYINTNHLQGFTDIFSDIVRMIAMYGFDINGTASHYLSLITEDNKPTKSDISFWSDTCDNLMHSISSDPDLTGADRVKIMQKATETFLISGDPEKSISTMKHYLNNSYNFHWNYNFS